MALLTVPTFDQAIARIRSRIRTLNRNVTTLPGSVLGDVFVVPQALSDVQQQSLTFYAVQIQAVTDILALENDPDTLALLATALETTTDSLLAELSATLDKLGANVSVTRLSAVQAVGNAVFARTGPPTSDLTVNTGSTVRSSSGQQYVTTATVTMLAAQAATYFDPTLSLFVISVPAQASVAGTAGNAPANTVTDILTPVNGLPLVTNTDNFDGGRDVEADDAYGARILQKWQALGAVTKAGVKSNILTNTSAGDVYLAPPGDEHNIRGFGRTDAYIRDRVDETITEVFSAFNHPTIASAIRPTNLPLTGLVSITSGTATLQRDQTSALRDSVQSLDAVRFTTAPTFPVTVSYTRNKRVSDAQNVFNDPPFAPLNQQDPVDTLTAAETVILVRQAPQLNVDYTATITVVPGQLKSQVIADVRQNILDFSSSLLLGQQVFLSDINEIVENTEGVLRLAGTPSKFAPSTQAGTLDVITPQENEIIVLANINIF